MPGAAVGSFRAVSQLLISSVWLKGCGGDDSSSFLAKILLRGWVSSGFTASRHVKEPPKRVNGGGELMLVFITTPIRDTL